MSQEIILKGIPASPGLTQGKVKIINFLEEIDELAKENIIVASFLTPDFVSLIKKNLQFSGIITDKGGATCHAAIVAREFKIPYIAGTVYATKKLKDDIIVTMDGEGGIVYK